MFKIPDISSSVSNLPTKVSELKDSITGTFAPTLRLGITGLARSGKTVFISALVHNLVNGGRLDQFSAVKSHRLKEVEVVHQAIDEEIARFDYETHIQNIIKDRIWPESTFQLAEIRITVEYTSASVLGRMIGPGRLHIDIVDYPGEWILDLTLLEKDYATWCKDTMNLSRRPARRELSRNFHAYLQGLDPNSNYDPETASQMTEKFTEYLKACRDDERALSRLPPGRFLLPGPSDMLGSNAMTFTPFDLDSGTKFTSGSLGERFERNYNSYKKTKVMPFFKNYFEKLDRQIILVDALPAINAGAEALLDLQHALKEILSCFRPGQNSWLTKLFPYDRKIDKILIAATKADHLYHTDHENYKDILKYLTRDAMENADTKGAQVDVMALASVRSTKEVIGQQGNNAIQGTPKKGAKFGGEICDGVTEYALFPGRLPQNAQSLFEKDFPENRLRFLPFRPPELQESDNGLKLELPHINLDRAMEFLLGDKLS